MMSVFQFIMTFYIQNWLIKRAVNLVSDNQNHYQLPPTRYQYQWPFLAELSLPPWFVSGTWCCQWVCTWILFQPHHRSNFKFYRHISSVADDDNTECIGPYSKWQRQQHFINSQQTSCRSACRVRGAQIETFSRHKQWVDVVSGLIRWQSWRVWPLTCWWEVWSVRPRSCLLPCLKWWLWMSTTWGPLNSTWRSRGSKYWPFNTHQLFFKHTQ